MFEDSALDFDIDAIMEGTEPTLDMLLDEEEAFDAECEATVISDDIDDMAIDNIVGLDGLVTDDDIDAIDRGEDIDSSDPIDDDAEAGADDPEIFRLQKDLFQNTLLSIDDIKDLNEGMSIEDFTARVLKEAEELPVIGDNTGSVITQPPVTDEGDAGVCGECHHNPCICANPIEKPVEIKIDGDYKDKKIEVEIKPEEKEDEDKEDSFDLEKEFGKVDDDDFDVDLDDMDDEINAPMNTPAGPVQPLNDDKDDDSELPFAPTAPTADEDTEVEDSLSKLEEGDVEKMFTKEELQEIEKAYAEGYAKRLDELDAITESEEEELTEEEAALLEAYEAGYKAALEEVIGEDAEVVDEDYTDIDEMLESIQEGLEDIEIENDFEGSSINADQKDANKGLFNGPKDNVDEPAATNQNDTTLPFENVTVKGFADLEDESKAAMIK